MGFLVTGSRMRMRMMSMRREHSSRYGPFDLLLASRPSVVRERALRLRWSLASQQGLSDLN